MKRVSYMLSRRLLCCCLAMIMVTGILWSAAARAESVTIRIGDSSFSPEENVLSGWSDGKGWKNLAGKYVAMVDFDGRDTVVSADGGTVTLAVAGVNRIKTLKGRCSFNIVGTGIILLDSIEIEEGSISLMPDISLYDSGSAAVFLLNDGYYELINGSIPGILDESYELDDVKLRVPEGSSLVLGAMAIRSETWMPDGSDAPETEVRIYKNNVPWEDFDPVHENGTVEMKSAAARLTLNGNSSLTVENKATVKLEEITSTAMGRDFISTASAMDIKGNLTNDGTIEGGFINILDGGSLKGNGKVILSETDLKRGGMLSEKLKFEMSGLTVSGDGMSVKADIKDSVLYIKGSGVKLDDLTVSGTSYIGINSEGTSGYSQGYHIPEIGDVRFPGGGSLDIVCNNHPYVPGGNDPARYVEDCRLKVTGTVTGGKIRVLAGITEYTGSSMDSIPVVPGGYASRVLVSSF
ncbi:MAG: hypothetical protein IJT24_00705, partial [Lachnospiraceae bacterium]|nr:hypothetical protein [Lachnospiraceae bacterium]